MIPSSKPLKFIEISVVTDGACKDCTIREVIDPEDFVGMAQDTLRAASSTLKTIKQSGLYKDGGQAEIEMLNTDHRESILKNVLKEIPDKYDYMLVDCSPSLGLLTVNALTASNSVIVPVQCEYFALEGLGKLLNTIKIIQKNLNRSLIIEGFLLTMYDSRLRLSNQVVEEVRKHFQQMVFETIIQRNVKLSEAPSYGQPAILYDAESRGAVNYLNLAQELIEKGQNGSGSNADI